MTACQLAAVSTDGVNVVNGNVSLANARSSLHRLSQSPRDNDPKSDWTKCKSHRARRSTFVPPIRSNPCCTSG